MNAPALVLVPGLLCDETVWAGQLPALRESATVQIAEHGLRNSLGAMAEAIIGQAPQRFAIAGHSMGGRVALEVLRRVPGRVSALALLDTGCHALAAGEAGQKEISGRMTLLKLAKREGMRAMAWQWLQGMVHPSRLVDATLTDAIIEMIGRRTPEHYAAQIDALLARPEAGALLAEIRCPTLVLCGREDSWASVDQHRDMAALIPDAKLRIVERCGHMCTMEQPDELSAALSTWLATSHTISAG